LSADRTLRFGGTVFPPQEFYPKVFVLCLKKSVQVLPEKYEPTGCTVYFLFISVINLYMFRAVLLLITRRYYSVYAAIYNPPSYSIVRHVFFSRNLNGLSGRR